MNPSTRPVAITWGPPPDRPILSPDIPHVWRVPLQSASDRQSASRRVLSPEEIGRAERFKRPADGARFAAAHAALRIVLAKYLDLPPHTIAFTVAKRGKPRLTGAAAESDLRFNLSHSGDLAAIAVVAGREIGIDLEQYKDGLDYESIAKRFFSPDEVEVLRAQPEADRIAAFYRCWTRKEAYIKARGEGITIGLETFAVAFGPGESPRLLHAKEGEAECSRWSMFDLHPAEGFEGALVVQGDAHPPQCFDWAAPA